MHRVRDGSDGLIPGLPSAWDIQRLWPIPSGSICLCPLVGKINAIFWLKQYTVRGWSQWRGCSGTG